VTLDVAPGATEQGQGVVRAPPARSILFVSRRSVTNPLSGGSELLVDELAAGMSRRGYDVALMCGDPVEPRPYYRVVRGGGPYLQYVRAPFEYQRAHRSTDLVVEVCNGMPFLAPVWRRGPVLCLVPHVHTEQWGTWFNPVLAAFGRTMEAKVMPRVHRRNLVVTISPSTRASLAHLGVDDESVRVVPLGVAVPPEMHRRSTAPLFIAAGRLVAYKQVDRLLSIWDSVRPFTGGRLVVMGEGPERARLEAMGITGVEFTGYVPESEKHRLMCQAWILLHASSWEGWGLVISEAAIRRTPTIGFDVPGVRDAILDRETGMLASSDEAFKRHWLELARRPVLRAALGEAAMKRVQLNSWSATVDAFELIVAEAMKRHRMRTVGGQALPADAR
jgi:glycosyltransferase involved in cell wall biosynthesis